MQHIINISARQLLLLSLNIQYMGNSNHSYIEETLGNPFFAADKKDEQAAKILSEFKFVSSYQDELFQKCSVIEHKETAQLIVTKQINCENEAQMNKLYSDFQRRRDTLTSENLVRLRYILKKKTDGMFKDEYKILLFFDYILISAQAEYMNRIKKKNYFTAQEINILLAGAIRGYSALEDAKIPNDKVRLKNIYFGIKDRGSIVKVIDSKLFPTESNVKAVRGRDGNDDIFLAPEQLKGTSNEKSGVYSLGIGVMQLCLLQPSRELYNYQNGSLDYKQIETRLNIVKNKYPLSVYYLIRQMLQRNDDSRPSFKKLCDNLPTNIKNLPQSINLSVVGRTTQHITKETGQRTKILPPVGYTKTIIPKPLDPSERNMHQTSLAAEYRPTVNASEVYTNGNMYTGQKKDDLRHGKGKYLYSDGSYYYGEWFKGRMQGQGKLYDTDGNLQYEGEWKNDHYQGKGILYGLGGVDWIKYTGEFKNGKMQGFGEMYFRDGNRYKGEFRSDLPWGKGRMFSRDGEVCSGRWERGDFVGEN